MWKRQQVHENAREMHRGEVLGKELGEDRGKQHMGGHDMPKKNGQAVRSFDLVQKDARVTHDRKWYEN